MKNYSYLKEWRWEIYKYWPLSLYWWPCHLWEKSKTMLISNGKFPFGKHTQTQYFLYHTELWILRNISFISMLFIVYYFHNAVQCYSSCSESKRIEYHFRLRKTLDRVLHMVIPVICMFPCLRQPSLNNYFYYSPNLYSMIWGNHIKCQNLEL